MVATLVVIPRRPCGAAPHAQICVQSQPVALLWQFLTELAALHDHAATLDDMRPEFLRYLPF
jgi:hypothetical protein